MHVWLDVKKPAFSGLFFANNTLPIAAWQNLPDWAQPQGLLTSRLSLLATSFTFELALARAKVMLKVSI